MRTTYNPFEEMTRMFEEMRNAFWDFDDGFRHGADRDSMLPAETGRSGTNLDLAEREGEYVLSADLPGFETEEITLTFDDGLLTVVAEHDEGDGTVARSRRVYERVTIPKPVEEDAATATYRNGVLEIRMPIVGEDDESGHVIEIED